MNIVASSVKAPAVPASLAWLKRTTVVAGTVQPLTVEMGTQVGVMGSIGGWCSQSRRPVGFPVGDGVNRCTRATEELSPIPGPNSSIRNPPMPKGPKYIVPLFMLCVSTSWRQLYQL